MNVEGTTTRGQAAGPSDSDYVRIDPQNPGDLLTRLQRAQVSIAADSRIMCPELLVGRGTRINGPILVKGTGPCRIGKYCAFGEAIRIITNNHHTNLVNLNGVLQQKVAGGSVLKPGAAVTIGDNVWIGDAAIILPGVSIGPGAVIGAGAVVSKDVPPYAVVVGSPARTIKYRFPEKIISQLLEISWWNWPEDRMVRNKAFFLLDLTSDPDLDLFSVLQP